MNSHQLALAVETAYNLRRPLMIWGPPGIGKTEAIAQTCKKLDLDLIDMRANLRDPTDIRGFPMPDAKTHTMKFFRDAELPTKGRGILFFDELVSGAPATQAAIMQLGIKNHKGQFAIGDYILPEGWSIVAAGNRETDRGVVHRMPTPVANRFTHVELEVDPKAWVSWAITDGSISPELIAFIRFKEELLFKFDPKADAKAFPTPRSWVATEEITQEKIPDDVKYELIKGTVGDGPGSEYWAFRKLINELPSIEDIILSPGKTKVPGEDQLSARYAITTLMGANANETSFEPFLEYSERMDKEFQACFVRDALLRDSKIKTLKVYAKWALKNSEVIVGN